MSYLKFDKTTGHLKNVVDMGQKILNLIGQNRSKS